MNKNRGGIEGIIALIIIVGIVIALIIAVILPSVRGTKKMGEAGNKKIDDLTSAIS